MKYGIGDPLASLEKIRSLHVEKPGLEGVCGKGFLEKESQLVLVQ
jgi:hypothetical protein